MNQEKQLKEKGMKKSERKEIEAEFVYMILKRWVGGCHEHDGRTARCKT